MADWPRRTEGDQGGGVGGGWWVGGGGGPDGIPSPEIRLFWILIVYGRPAQALWGAGFRPFEF